MRFVILPLVFCSAMFSARAALGQPYLFPPPGGSEAIPPDASSAPWTPPDGTASAQAGVQPAPSTVPIETLPAPADAGGIGNTAGEATAAAAAAVGAPEVNDDESPTWYQRAFMLVPAPWDTGIELGLNGSTGTSDSFSLRTGGYIKRSSRYSKLDVSGYYNRTGSGGATTQNNAQFDFRNDWLLDEASPWTLFATNTEFYDQFKDFDLQMNVDAGVGYRIFHDKDLELIGRVGGGTSREFGGLDDRWVPELLFGFGYSQQLSATQKFYGKLDWFPELEQFGEYRMVADTGWEVVLVQPSNLSLKISATDRFDSTPNGSEPHLVNYSVLLLLKL